MLNRRAAFPAKAQRRLPDGTPGPFRRAITGLIFAAVAATVAAILLPGQTALSVSLVMLALAAGLASLWSP